jgi:phosphatidylglycerol:prolipoprotein diacylglycerol transferase
MKLAILPYPHLDPVLLHLGPLAIRWYALSYIVGLLLAWWGILLTLRRKALWAAPPFNGKPPATEDQIGDLVVWATFGVILGGRLGWDLIYGIILCSVSPDADFCRGMPMAFVTDPIKLIAAWEGGMSFHGGLFGVIIAVAIFARRQKLKFLTLADLCCAFAPVGLFFGRLANFVNGELWGRVTDVPWAMIFPRAGELPRHPSQLYEAASEGVLLFLIMQICLWLGLHRRPGLLTAVFFLGYGTFRFICEFFREPDAPFL